MTVLYKISYIKYFCLDISLTHRWATLESHCYHSEQQNSTAKISAWIFFNLTFLTLFFEIHMYYILLVQFSDRNGLKGIWCLFIKRLQARNVVTHSLTIYKMSKCFLAVT